MAASGTQSPRDLPKLLKATFLADTEGLLRETRATALFYFPAPVFWLFIFGILDYSAFALRNGFSDFPLLTDLWRKFPAVGSYTPGAYLTIFFSFVTLLLLLWLLVRYLRWISTVYAVSTHRVIVQSGILGKDFDEIPIPQVRGVDVHQSAFQRLLGYGTVRVSSEGGARTSIGNEDWHGIPKPFEFQRLIESANQVITRGRT
ncbi:MAG: PH domain-containing protein [Thermoplasmata archaeon]|nr:PH domain-containing protein [Thermoplasmata archaeon]MCI4353938.1 PH domain-containing protein [Thermoplasmata archaeon]